jgi:protein TonB
MRSMTGSITIPRVPVRFMVVAAAHVGLFYIVTDALRFELAPEAETLTVVPTPDEEPPVTDQEEPRDPTVKTWTYLPDPVPPKWDYPDEEVAPPDVPRIHVPPPDTGDHGVLRGSAEFVPVRVHPDHPLTRAPYPPGPIRENKEGVVELAIYVLRNGRIAEVKVAKSSGDPRFDRAAVEEARRHWRLQPATRGGEAIDAWGSFRVVFRLDRR